jgi:branched-chain amino acid transport system permease protein
MNQTLQVSRMTRLSLSAMAVLLLALVVMAAAPWWAGRADLRLFGEFFLYLSLASLWNFLAGYAAMSFSG